MLKNLLKKEFMLYKTQMAAGLEKKSKKIASNILFGILIAILILSFGGLFYINANSLARALALNNSWIYFSIMGILTLFIGIFGSIFNTYTGIYKSKDNDLLLSMPIKSSTILLSKMIYIYVVNMIFIALVWIPTIINFWIYGKLTFLTVVIPILMMFFMGLVTTVITCLFGWILALISNRLPGKNIVVILLSVIFVAVYYYLCFKFMDVIQSIILYSLFIGQIVKTKMHFLYLLGLASSGNILAFIIFAAISLAIFGICYYILSKSFINIITSNKGEKFAKYKEKEYKMSSVDMALLRREKIRFLKSPAYVLNSSFGALILMLLCVVAVVKRNLILDTAITIGTAIEGGLNALPVIVAAFICMIIAMDCITAPSISLEGKTLDNIKSLPVSTEQIFKAKINLSVIINCGIGVIASWIFVMVLGLSSLQLVVIIAVVITFSYLYAYLGLALNILKPNLTWTNENVPIKQSVNVVITLLLGWVIVALMVILFIFIMTTFSSFIYLWVWYAVFSVGLFLLRKWLFSKGVARFEKL